MPDHSITQSGADLLHSLITTEYRTAELDACRADLARLQDEFGDGPGDDMDELRGRAESEVERIARRLGIAELSFGELREGERHAGPVAFPLPALQEMEDFTGIYFIPVGSCAPGGKYLCAANAVVAAGSMMGEPSAGLRYAYVERHITSRVGDRPIGRIQVFGDGTWSLVSAGA